MLNFCNSWRCFSYPINFRLFSLKIILHTTATLVILFIHLFFYSGHYLTFGYTNLFAVQEPTMTIIKCQPYLSGNPLHNLALISYPTFCLTEKENNGRGQRTTSWRKEKSTSKYERVLRVLRQRALK